MKKSEDNENEKQKSILRTILIIIGIIVGIILLGIIALYIYVAVGSKKLDSGYDALKNEMSNYEGIKYSEIPQDLIDAVVSAEQPYYFSKNSRDFKRIINIMPLISDVGLNNKTIPMIVLDNRTITEIIVDDANPKNTRLKKYLYNLELAYFSKHVFEKEYTKEEILAYYMNSQYLGGQSYGIKEAAQYYFGKTVESLTLAESAMIAGLFDLPGRYNPYYDIEAAEQRKNLVINLMYRYDYITNEERDNAINTKIRDLLANELISYKVTYNHNQEESFGSDDLGKKFNFKIEKGILTITDINNNVYRVESIPNLKYIELLSPTSIDNIRLFMLTNSGKVYIGENIYKLEKASDFTNVFKELNIDKKVIDIGYTKDYKMPPISNFLVLKTENGEYLYTDTSYDRYVAINSSKGNNAYNSIIDIQKYVSLDKTENDYKSYSINLKKAYEDNKLFDSNTLSENKITLKYKIDDYDVTLKPHNSASTNMNYPIYDLYVNGHYVYKDDALWDPQITLFHNYIIFKYNGTTNIRSLYLYIVDNNGNISKLNELDSANVGMRGNEFKIDNNKLSIWGYRMTHNASIVYNGHADDGYYSLSNKNGCEHALNELPSDFLIEAVYSYKYENGKLNMTPEISDKVTLKEYIEKHNLCK